jgi:hypothetical protein
VIDGSYFAADGSYHCPGGAGCAAGTGYLVSDATSGGCGTGNSCPQYDSISFIHNTWGQQGAAPDHIISDGGTGPTNPVIADYRGNVGTNQEFYFANVFTCRSSTIGFQMPIRDDTAPVSWGANIAATGGGTNHVLGYCDSSGSWTMAAK